MSFIFAFFAFLFELIWTFKYFFAFALIFLQLVWWVRIFTPKKRRETESTKFILFASESGQAQKLAQETQKQLGKDWQSLSLAAFVQQLGVDKLNGATALFIVSTTGDGDAPENGRAFLKQIRNADALTDCQYALLALGDREYPKFCQFGIDLDAQLTRVKAKPCFEMITVDNLNEATLQKWSASIAETFSVAQIELESNLSKPFDATLTHRHFINPNSPAEGLFDIRLHVPTTCTWQAGDIVQITVPQANEKSVMREYSIANAYQTDNDETELSLLVRQLVIDVDKNLLGKGSGFLTQHADIGTDITLRIRENSTFKLPSAPVPMIFIATGSGLAGVASLLDEADKRWSQPFNEHQGGHWLIYGERHPEHERPYADKLTDWQDREVLTKVTHCFSRCPDEKYPKYVQDGIKQHAETIKTWLLDREALVYVCGSKDRLGEAIPTLLTDIVGDAKLVKRRLMMDVY